MNYNEAWLKADRDKKIEIRFAGQFEAVIVDSTGPSREVFALATGETITECLNNLDTKLFRRVTGRDDGHS